MKKLSLLLLFTCLYSSYGQGGKNTVSYSGGGGQTYTAGTGITISGNVISATGTNTAVVVTDTTQLSTNGSGALIIVNGVLMTNVVVTSITNTSLTASKLVGTDSTKKEISINIGDGLTNSAGTLSVAIAAGSNVTLATNSGSITIASSSPAPSDTAYASSWNGVTTIAPTKNAVYDWGHTFDTDDNGKVNVLDMIAGIPYTDANGVIQGPITIGSGLTFAAGTLSASGSGSQTPLNSDIDAAGHAITNSTTAGTETWIDFAKEYNPDLTGITDCSALLQAAVTRALSPTNTPHIATIYFRSGYYNLGTTLDSTNNAIINLPFMLQPGANQYTNWSSIRFLGPDRPVTWEGTSLNNKHAVIGAVIRANPTSGSVFASQFPGSNNILTPIFENITFEHTNGFAGTWLNFTNTICFGANNISIHHALGNTSVSTTPTGIGINGPKAALGNWIYLNNVDVCSLGVGVILAEHTEQFGLLNLVGNCIALQLTNGTLANSFSHIMCQNNGTNINIVGPNNFYVGLLNIERGNPQVYSTTTWDILDTGVGRGFVGWKAQDNTDVNQAHKLKITANSLIATAEVAYNAFQFQGNSQTSTLWQRGPSAYYVDNSARSGGFTVMKARGTSGSPSVPSSGDGVGSYDFAGLDAATAAPSFQSSASILGVTDGASSAGNVPIAIYGYTGVATATRTNRFQIASAGAFSSFMSWNDASATGSTATLNDIQLVYLANVDGITVTLPTAVGTTASPKRGRRYTIKAIAPATTVTIATSSSQLIDGASTYSLSASNKYVTVSSDNANWWVIANN